MRITRINEEEEIYIQPDPEIDASARAQDFIREAVTRFRAKQEIKEKRAALLDQIRMVVSTACIATLLGIAIFRMLP